jgi:adenylate kinase
MCAQKNNQTSVSADVHNFLERTLIEAYLKGKGYSLDDLKKLPEETARQLMKEASTYASGKLAEMELKAHFVQELHDAYLGE